VVHAIRVRKKEANSVMRRLIRDNLLDDKWKIVEDGDYLIIPVKGWVDKSFEYPLPRRKRKKSPYEKIVEIAKEMGIKREKLPDYWEKIGDVLILPGWNFGKYEEKIGEIYARVLNVKTVCIYEGIEGELRVQRVRKVYGISTETVHIENGIKYNLDVSKIMFSSGNVGERIRMGKIKADGEIVVDMFAGIGYFSLPIAKYGNPMKIYACEKNPVAFGYLLKNIRLNEISSIIPLLGDNRRIAPRYVADRVILGYMHTEKFLDAGIRALKRGGGIIHYHDTYTTEEKKWKPEKNIRKHARKYGFEVEIIFKRTVKSYAPHIWHIVVDARLSQKIKY